jgi:ubiquitin carboxyl-terminal hydrolase 9/13
LAASSTPVPTKLLDGDELLFGIPVSSLDKGKTRAEGGDGETDEAPLELPSSPVGLGSFAGANNSTSSTSSSNGSAKRATRKMSLTSPLLGLGWKKDKQKDKEKSPSSFHFGGKGV